MHCSLCSRWFSLLELVCVCREVSVGEEKGIGEAHSEQVDEVLARECKVDLGIGSCLVHRFRLSDALHTWTRGTQ